MLLLTAVLAIHMSVNKHTVHFGIKSRSLLKFGHWVTGRVPLTQWIMKSDCMEKTGQI